jgi:hypothetical protein
VRKEDQPKNDPKEQQTQRLKGIERLHEKSSTNKFKGLAKALWHLSRNA